MSYQDQFLEAVRFTQTLGFAVPALQPQTAELVSPENGDRVMQHVKAAGIPDLARSALQCLKWSYALLPYVEAGLGCRVALTVGQVSIGPKRVFDPSQADFARWANTGVAVEDFAVRSGFNFHAWYTLPSMEILDMTLWSTLAVAWDNPKLSGNVVGGWPDLIAPNPTFIPIVVGTAYVEHVHAISDVPLLSRGASFKELCEIPMLLLRT
jgi:hypothetical protein